MTTRMIHQTHDRSTRGWVVPASAVAFAVLFIAGALMSEAGGHLEGKTGAQVVSIFESHKGQVLASVWLFMLAGFAFIPLAWGLRGRVSTGLSDLGDHVATVTANLYVALVIVAAGAGGTLAFTVVFEPEHAPASDLIRFVPLLADPIMLVGAALSVGIFLAVVSRAGQKSASVPTWFTALGFVTAVAMPFALFAVPYFLLPIWALGAAYVMRKQPVLPDAS